MCEKVDVTNTTGLIGTYYILQNAYKPPATIQIDDAFVITKFGLLWCSFYLEKGKRSMIRLHFSKATRFVL